jgi:hypothetical protein
MTQTTILLSTLHVMTFFSLGYGLGWLFDPQRPLMVVMNLVFDMSAIELEVDAVKREVRDFMNRSRK